MSNNSSYLELVKSANAKKLNIVKEQQKEIKDMYKSIAEDYSKSLNNLNKKSLSYRRIKDYEKALTKEYKNLEANINGIIKKNMEKSAEIAVSPQLSFFNAACSKADINTTFSSMFSRIPKEAVEEIYSGGIYEDNKSLSSRIWGTVNKSNKDIQSIVAMGIAVKKTPYELAKDLESYVMPGAKKGFDWGRVYPGSNKTIDYNAQRLARTAVQHAFQMAQKRSCAKNPYVEGIQWISALIHGRTCDKCRERHMKIYKADKSPMDHPNGICSTIPYITKSIGEIGQELRDWLDGKENATLDGWFSAYGYEFANVAKPASADLSQGVKGAINNLLMGSVVNAKTKKLFDKYLNEENVVIDYDFDAPFAYSRNLGKIKLNPKHESLKNYNMVEAMIHETIHFIDDSEGLWLSNIELFDTNIPLAKEVIYNNLDKYKALFDLGGEYEYNMSMSDIFSALTENEIEGAYRHEIKYWQTIGMREMEIFADLMAEYFANNESGLKLISDIEPLNDLMKGLIGIVSKKY